MANDYKVFGLTEIDNDHLLSYAGSAGSAVGIFARIFWGALLDRYEFRYVFGGNAILATIQAFTVYWVVNSEWGYFLYVVIVFWNGAGNYTCFVCLCGMKFSDQSSYVWGLMIWAMTSSCLATILIDKIIL